MGFREVRRHLRIHNQIVREILAELIGTFILVTFAVGSGAQYVLSNKTMSSYLTVNFASGMGLTFGIYWAGGVTGAMLNPAVALAFCLQGQLAWYKLPIYSAAQLVGAFMAAAVQFGVFIDGINAFDGGTRMSEGPRNTASIFASYPNDNVSTLNCFFDQVFGTFILIGCILAVTDKRNMKTDDKGLIALALGSIVFAIGTCWGYNCGYPLNPARDLGPRLFTAAAGWGLGAFKYRQYYWFTAPIFGPICGAIVAWFLYNIFICLHWPKEHEVEVVLNEDVTSKDVESNGNVKGTGADNPSFVPDSGVASTHM